MHFCSWRQWFLLGIVTSHFLFLPSAYAEGLYLAPNGVQPLALGGAVAADYQQAIALFYNPAGLAGSPLTLELQAVFPWQRAFFSQTHSGVLMAQQGKGISLPLPFLGATIPLSTRLHAPVLGIAIGTEIPNFIKWESQEIDSPLRYAVRAQGVNFLLKSVLGIAARVHERLSIGAGLQFLSGTLAMTTILSACDGVVCVQPEDPGYDVTVGLKAIPVWSTALSLGAIYTPHPAWQLGLSLETGNSIKAPVALLLQLPHLGPYIQASVTPSAPRGKLFFQLPGVLRLGLRWQPQSRFHLELIGNYVPWHVHRTIRVVPDNLVIENLLASFVVRPVVWQRGLHDTVSVALGSQFTPQWWQQRLRLRLGLRWEPAAIDSLMLAPGLVDLTKIMFSTGLGVHWQHVAIDASYAYILMQPRTIAVSQVRVPNVIYPTSTALTPTIGEGHYRSWACVAGLSLRFSW